MKNALRESIITFYKSKLKKFTKNEARKIIDEIEFPSNILDKKIGSLSLEQFEIISEKLKNYEA